MHRGRAETADVGVSAFFSAPDDEFPSLRHGRLVHAVGRRTTLLAVYSMQAFSPPLRCAVEKEAHAPLEAQAQKDAPAIEVKRHTDQAVGVLQNSSMAAIKAAAERS